MSKIVDDLKRGIRTLETKVRNLETVNQGLESENRKLKNENWELKCKLKSIEDKHKKEDELMINHFGEIFKQMSDLVINNMD